MFTFSAKPRVVRLRQGARLTLPGDVSLAATLGPAWLFGAGGHDPQFVVAGSTGVSMFFNGNTGRWYCAGGTQPQPPDVSVDLPTGGVIRLQGCVASLSFRANSLDHLAGAAESMLFGLPTLLNSRMPFPCVVESVTGSSSGGEFGYEIETLELRVPLVLQDRYVAEITDGLRYLARLSDHESARLQAALSYFYRSARLLEAGQTQWEFAAEVVLNLSKCLEALFPPAGDGRTRDAVRQGLADIGFSNDDVETWFLPALSLRSHLDVAHVRLAVLGRHQVEVLARYVDGALPRFRELLERILSDALRGEVRVANYSTSAIDGAALESLSQLATRLAKCGPPFPGEA